MKTIQSLSAVLCMISLVTAAPRNHHQISSITSTTAAVSTVSTAAAASGNADTSSTTVTRGAQTLVLFEVNGVPGNECLTFRNNGMINTDLILVHLYLGSNVLNFYR